MIDKNTFGDSPAAIDLVEVINENDYKCEIEDLFNPIIILN